MNDKWGRGVADIIYIFGVENPKGEMIFPLGEKEKDIDKNR